jgi:hypothetical protein
MSQCRYAGTSLGRGIHANFFVEAIGGLGTRGTRRQAQATRNC